MLLLFIPMFVADVVAALMPVRTWPPDGRRCLLLLDLLLVFKLFTGALEPPHYSEWGMGDLGPKVLLIAAVLLFLSLLPVAKKCLFRARH